jgi:succinate dehydrogenase / fumarate reductase membrane anchor subunit
MWIFTRISGLLLLLLAFVGTISAFVMKARLLIDLQTLWRWTFFPNSYHVVNSNIPDVTQGWANAWWQAMQILIVFFGVSHGSNGLRVVIEDYIGHTILRPLLRGLIFLLWLALLVIAVFVILQA